VYAYSQEGVTESPEEAFRVRKYVICYRGADGTLEIHEPREDNSGLIQGPTLSRHRVPKDVPDVRSAGATIAGLTGASDAVDTSKVEYVDWRDLQVGAEVSMYGRAYHIYDADGFTRSWFAARGVPLADAEEVPVDTVGSRLEVAKRSGGKTDKGHNKIMFPAKLYAEARLGKFIRDPEERRKFQVCVCACVAASCACRVVMQPIRHCNRTRPPQDHDGKVLMFDGMWDDSATEYGDQRHVVVQVRLLRSTTPAHATHHPRASLLPVRAVLPVGRYRRSEAGAGGLPRCPPVVAAEVPCLSYRHITPVLPSLQANNDGYGLGATLLSKRKVPRSWVVAK